MSGGALPPELALFTDLYELTMLQAYYAEGMTDIAVFDLSVRSLPEERNFLLACGLEDVLAYLEGLRFAPPAGASPSPRGAAARRCAAPRAAPGRR